MKRDSMKHHRRIRICFFVLQLVVVVPCSAEADSVDAYMDVVQPFVRKYCVECHTGKMAKGEFDLDDLADWSRIDVFTRA